MRLLSTVIVFFVLTTAAGAQEWFIFPNEDQDQEQQDLDEFQCIRIATDRTGFDPMATPTATTRAPETRGGAVQGAATGAVLGMAIGGVASGSSGRRTGLRTGAAAGGLMGGMSRADSRAQQDQWAREEAANYQRNRNNFTRAFTACMESRGYTVG